MLIHFENTGPLVQYDEGVLIISDLNPETRLDWRMSRWQMVKLGVGFIRAALSRSDK